MTIRKPMIPRRAHETESEQRLREGLNRKCGEVLHLLDSAISLRTAPDAAQHLRQRARTDLGDFCTKAMLALAFTEETKLPLEQDEKGD